MTSALIDGEIACFLANHPFLIVLKDVNTHLFIGRIKEF